MRARNKKFKGKTQHKKEKQNKKVKVG